MFYKHLSLFRCSSNVGRRMLSSIPCNRVHQVLYLSAFMKTRNKKGKRMEHKIEKVEGSEIKRKIIISVTPEEMKEIENQVVKRYQKQAQIPGFRKGRAPAGLVKKEFGDSIQMDVMETAISRFYGQALDEIDVEPVSQGKVTNIDFESADKGMTFEIEIEVEPEIELKKYKGLKVEREKVVVTPAMVEDVINNIRKQYATAREIDEVKEGAVVKVDIQQLGEGNVPIVGRKYEDVEIEVGKGEFDPEIEKQLVGMKSGEKKIIHRENPAEGAEKPATTEAYEVTVKEIVEKELPELTDEFVEELGQEDYKTVEEFRAAIEKMLRADLERRTTEVFHERLIDEALKENPFDVPEGMVDHYLHHVVEDFKQQLKNQKIDEEAIRQSYRPTAIRNIRWYLLSRKIAEVEGLEVSDEEIEKVIDEDPRIPQEQKELLKKDEHFKGHLVDDLLGKKILDFLAEHAEITEVLPEGISQEDLSEGTESKSSSKSKRKSGKKKESQASDDKEKQKKNKNKKSDQQEG